LASKTTAAAVVNAELIQAEHDRLGYVAGWRFMTAPTATLASSPVALVGLNPGGNRPDEWPSWSQESGSSYVVEAWDPPRPVGSAVLQRQVQLMLGLLGAEPNRTFSAQFVPFRSKSWDKLPRQEEALEFSRTLWRWLLPQMAARVLVCLGDGVARELAKLTDAKRVQRHPAGWANVTIDRFEAADGRVIVKVPHLSRYALFGRKDGQSAAAERALRAAATAHD
jgi:hypothetical protein